jgi:hypothetical protein
MSLPIRWLLSLTAILASNAVACSMTESRPAVAAVTPIECTGATLQSDADAAAYAGCEAVTGDLRVVGSDFQDLTALERIRSVSGTLEIGDNAKLDDLTGLEHLTQVGRLVIRDNADLDDLRGLEALERADQLTIVNNGLLDTSGLSGLRQVGTLTVSGNAKLVSLGGLDGVSRVHSLRIESNPRLCAGFGLLPALGSVEQLFVRDNRGLAQSEVEQLEARLGAGAELAAL